METYLQSYRWMLLARILEENLDFPRVTKRAGSRVTYTWARNDVTKVRSEPLAGDSNAVTMQVTIGSPQGWGR